MPQIIIKNNSGSDVSISDLGISLSNNSQRILSDEFRITEISSSDNLKTLVTNGTLIVNDSFNDLSIPNALKHLTVETEWYDETLDDEIKEAPEDSKQYVRKNKTWEEVTAISDPWIISNTPPSSPENGWGYFDIDDHMLYTFDSNRNCWISINRQTYQFSYSGSGRNRYLDVASISSSDVGYYIAKNAVITGIFAREVSGSSKEFHIRNQNDTPNLGTFTMTTGEYFSVSNNIKISSGDRIRVFIVNEGGNVTRVLVTIEIAWRYDVI